MKNLTALIAAAALLGTTTLAPAMYAPMKSGLTGEIVLAQTGKDKDKDKDKDKMGKDKKDKAKPKPKAKDKMKDKDKDKDKGKG